MKRIKYAAWYWGSRFFVWLDQNRLRDSMKRNGFIGVDNISVDELHSFFCKDYDDPYGYWK